MTTILAIDTSTDACSVALMTGEKSIIESSVIAAREHTQRILPMIAQLLEEQGVQLREVDAIAFGCGPGSFTGLRICISIAQGLAYGADIPLIPISNLQALAYSVLRSQYIDGVEHKIDADSCILPVFDARMGEVYCAAYQACENASGIVLQPVLSEMVCSPEACQEAVGRLNMAKIYPAGSGWQYDLLSKTELGQDTITLVNKPVYSNAVDIATLAWRDYQLGKTIKATDAEPTYLRNEISWKKRTRIRNNVCT